MSAESSMQDINNVLGMLAQDINLLAGLHDKELDNPAIATLQEIDFPDCFALMLSEKGASDASLLLRSALQELHNPAAAALDELAADYADIYLNHGLQASPCESVWLDEDGLIMQEPMFQIRDWYQRYELAAEDWRVRSDDHLSLQLQFMAHLVYTADKAESPVDTLGELARFMDEHPLRWIDDFAQRVAQRCATPFYAGLALLTASYLDALRELLVLMLDQPRPTAEQIEERMKPKAESVEVPLTYMPGSSPSW